MDKEMKAFPASDTFDRDSKHGMDLRDYFAAKAMQGLLSTVKDEEWKYDEVATIAYGMADAMMQMREKNNE
jgi:hypothetical protein